jgi:hypothetical protein
MANRRVDGRDACPIDELPLRAETKCSTCRYFRGASKISRSPWAVLCNWPRSGAEEAVRPMIRFDQEWWNAEMAK